MNGVYRSLGVLLYTLVYGAMPFDGSNFKRLVKQITTGDYYEPKQPSSKIFKIFKSKIKRQIHISFLLYGFPYVHSTDISNFSFGTLSQCTINNTLC